MSFFWWWRSSLARAQPGRTFVRPLDGTQATARDHRDVRALGDRTMAHAVIPATDVEDCT